MSKLFYQEDKEDRVNDYSYFSFVIYKCNAYVSSTYGEKCETDDKKFLNFLKSFVVEINFISDKINFKKYETKPVNKVRTALDWV